jgi:hypothetical protein
MENENDYFNEQQYDEDRKGCLQILAYIAIVILLVFVLFNI